MPSRSIRRGSQRCPMQYKWCWIEHECGHLCWLLEVDVRSPVPRVPRRVGAGRPAAGSVRVPRGSRLRIVVYRRAIGSSGPWLEAQTACRYYGRTVPLAEVQTAARQEIERRVGHPSISVQPPGGQTLVNIPTIFSAAEQRTTTLPITSPVPGQIKAVPSYSWTFGDGLTGTGSGHPFTPSIVPNESGNNGYYVVAVYRQPGTKSITATLRWDVTFTLQGFGTITPAPIVFTDTVQLHARTARAVLVNH